MGGIRSGYLRTDAGDRRREAGDRRLETGDRRQETGDRRQETGDTTTRQDKARQLVFLAAELCRSGL